MNMDKYIDALYYEEYGRFADDCFDPCEHKRPIKIRCIRGPRGPMGPKGKDGKDGRDGCPGKDGKDAIAPAPIIPFASGTEDFDLTVTPAIARPAEAIGFGDHNTVTITPATGFIDLATFTPSNNFAFVMPRSGLLKTLEATFTTTITANSITSPVIVTAQLYVAPQGSNVFTPIPSSLITFPVFTNATGTQLVFNGTANINYPVNQRDRVLLVYSATSTVPVTTGQTAISGTASAGLTIL
jgi:BclB C-terminal domain-containing protein